MASARYFATINGLPVPLKNVYYIEKDPVKRSRFDAGIAASQSGRIVRGDAWTLAVGTAPDGNRYEADRLVFRKANPSNHRCGAKCRHAKGGQCECECGGKFHGAGNGG